MRIIKVLTVLPLCASSSIEPEASDGQIEKWSLTKSQYMRLKREITRRDEKYHETLSSGSDNDSIDSDASVDSDASIESHTSFPDVEEVLSETIPETLAGEEFEGEYLLKQVVAHDEANILVGARRSAHGEKFIFKYQFNCFTNIWNNMCKKNPEMEKCIYAKRNPDALLHEYLIMRIVYEQTELAPEPIVLSPAIPLTTKSMSIGDGKFDFGLFEEPDEKISPKKCESVGSTSRVVVEEIVGQTVSDIFDKFILKEDRVPLDLEHARLAAKIFAESIRMLRRIHAIGIVHGDIHYGNIAFRTPLQYTDLIEREIVDLVFIDFGTSKFFPDEFGKDLDDISPIRNYFLSDNLLSPYQLEGHRVGRRDDIYRAFEAFVNVLVQGEIDRLFERTEKEKLFEIKSSANFCSRVFTTAERGRYPGLVVLNELAPEGTFDTIYKNLKEIQDYVRKGLPTPDSTPDYDWLSERANNIVHNLYL